jgi:hypothetical protein
MNNKLLICRVCGVYRAKQLHQHLMKEHSMTSKDYRDRFGEREIMQIGFNPEKKSKSQYNSDYVKKGYKKVETTIQSAKVYTKSKLKSLLEENELWKNYLGKTKYRSMIKHDPALYKSIITHTSNLPIKTTLEQKLKLIVVYDYDLNRAKCSCGKRYTFGKHCRFCSEHKRITMQRQVESKVGLKSVNYNKQSIPLLEQLAYDMGVTDLIHAENGGEFKVAGYYLDGYSLSANIAFEYDEKHHFQPDGSLKKRDLLRQDTIKNILHCKIVRLKYDGSITEY